MLKQKNPKNNVEYKEKTEINIREYQQLLPYSCVVNSLLKNFIFDRLYEKICAAGNATSENLKQSRKRVIRVISFLVRYT